MAEEENKNSENEEMLDSAPETALTPDDTPTVDRRKVVDITGEVKTAFLSYAMSVIVQRALPDARDGLKPVHRRILYGMNGLGVYADQPFKKSARIVGEVMGKYHPHGDSSIYEAMVRMAQPFSYRYPLVTGHGNFGDIDGDSAAAQRYTEARMSKLAMEMLRDIQKDTVDFVDTYTAEEQEPVVLPAKFPALLVNGSGGIAVGMATNIPPHNLTEVINGTIALIDNPDITISELMKYIPGPDFPTGGTIMGRSGINKAYQTGRGSIINRGKVEVSELENGRHRLTITEIPYMVNKKDMFTKIADMAREKKIEGITGLVDESNMDGIKIEIDIKKDIQPEVVANQLYRLTPLQTSFGIIMLALVDNVPRIMNLKEMLQVYVDHQVDIITRRSRFDLKKAEERAHILEGLRIAIDNIDEIVHIIRTAPSDPVAIETMMDKFALDEIQANAIMEMKLRRLTGLQRSKIEEEYQQLESTIADLKDILARHQRVLEIVKGELTDIKDKYGDARRSIIMDGATDIEDEDLINEESIIVSLTTNGYIKRVPVETYRLQNRGGRGVIGMAVNSDDVVEQLVVMSTHEDLLLFTNLGRVYRIRGHHVPESGRTGKGVPVVNLIPTEKDEKVASLVRVPKDEKKAYLFFVTTNGLVKRTAISEFDSIRNKGKIAITLKENDELFTVKGTGGDDEIIIAGSNGKAVRFNENTIRAMGRSAAGVKGFNTDGGHVVGAATDKQGSYILVLSALGYGKKTPLTDYRLTNRGAKGVSTIKTSEKTGDLVALKAVNGDEDCLIITDGGTVIRISLAEVSTLSRNTKGVKMINVDAGTKVASCAIVSPADDEPAEPDSAATADSPAEDAADTATAADAAQPEQE